MNFNRSLVFCPVGVELSINRVYLGRFGVNTGVKLESEISKFALMTKASAGTPQVKTSNGRLQIVLTHQGNSQYLTLGLSVSKQNRNYADMVARRIQNYKRPQLAQSTIAKDFNRVAKHIEKFPGTDLIDAVSIRPTMIETNSGEYWTE